MAAVNGTNGASFTKPSDIETRLFINGEFVPAKSGKKFDIYDPSTEKLSASVHEAGVDDVDDAVAAAKAAFPEWSAKAALERAGYLYRLADAMDRVADELTYLDAITMGKPLNADMQLRFAPTFLRYFAGRACELTGETSLNTPGMVNMTFRQPYGVTGAIIPWNGPVVMLAMKIGPALVSGNTMVLKSSEKAPLSILVIGRLCQEIGLPKGVLNILSGFGRPTGEAIAKHMDIRKLAFTGSAAAGRAIKKAAADSNLKNVTLELGGKSPLIVFEDADLEKAVPAAAISILANSGQVCMASSRIYVHASIADKFTTALTSAMKTFGANPSGSLDPMSASTNRGPQADKIQFDRVMSYLQEAKDAKLTTLTGGDRDGKTGYYIQPTILSDIPESSRLMREEIFGPVVCLNTFTEEDDVLRRANDTEYGLYASVYTKDVSRAMRVAKAFEAGTVGVNCTSPTVAFDLPFGGYKGSGDGRELGKRSLEMWTEEKTVLFAL